MSEHLADEAAEYLAAPNSCPSCGAPMRGDVACDDCQDVADLLIAQELAAEVPPGQVVDRQTLVRRWLDAFDE